MNEILKTTLLGLFFGTFGTTIRGNNRCDHKKELKQILKFHTLICIRTNDGSNMF